MSRQHRSKGKRSSTLQARRRKMWAQGKAASHLPQRNKEQFNSSPFRTKTLPLLLLIVVTLAAYVNAWPDSLAFDDKPFAASERFAGLSLSDFAHFFTENLWAASGITTGLYRPLLLVSIAMDAFVFGDWVAGYHLSNILLHLLVTLLLFGLIRHLLRVSGGQPPLSDHIALLAAMVFGVHPIHTEVVNSIFNRSGMLVSVGVIGGLWWFLRTVESSPRKAWGGLAGVYLVVLFCKESSVILPPLAVAMLWIFTPGNWRVQVRRSLPVLWLLVPLGIYLALRALALDAPGLAVATDLPAAGQMTATLDSSIRFDWNRLLPATLIWFDSLRLSVWPRPLQLYHSGFSTKAWIALVLQLMLVILAIVGFRQKRYGLIAGLAFFYITILPASHIIGEAGVNPHVAERYIYLPSAGLAIALAFALNWLAQRFRLRTAMAAVLIALVILTPITWARNAQWASDVLLYESDYRQGSELGYILPLLVGAHVREENYSRAVVICDRHADEMKINEEFSNRCGLAYGHAGRFDDAEHSFLLAINQQKVVASAHENLASLYLHLGRKNDALKHFELAVITEQNPAIREFRKGDMLMRLYPSDRVRLFKARVHFEQALQIQPQLAAARQMLEQLNRILGRAES